MLIEEECDCCEIDDEIDEMEECSSPEMEIEKTSTKQETFDEIINSQKASGEFINIESFIDEMKSFNYQSLNKIVVQTIFIIELLKYHFKEYKTEWNLMVKKAQQWIDSQNITIPDDMKAEMMKLIESMKY